MPQIELSEIVKNKLEKYKDIEGCKTFNEAVNLLISINGLSSELHNIVKENQQLLKKIKDIQTKLTQNDIDRLSLLMESQLLLAKTKLDKYYLLYVDSIELIQA